MRLLLPTCCLLAAAWMLVAGLGTDEAEPGSLALAPGTRAAGAATLLAAPGAAVGARLTGAPRLQGPAPSPPQDFGRALVRVLGDDRQPRTGCPLRIHDPDARIPVRYALTDNAGQVDLGTVRRDGRLCVEALDRWRSGGEGGRVLASARVEGALTHLCCRGDLPLEVRLEDAVSGGALPLSGVAATPSAPGEMRVARMPGSAKKDPVGITLPEEGLPGYVAWDPSVWRAGISRYTDRLLLVQPLRREARVEVHAEEYDGTPARGAYVSQLTIAGRTLRNELGDRQVYAGRCRLAGVPYFRAEEVSVQVERLHLAVDCDVEEEEPGLPYDIARGQGTLPRDPDALLLLTARFPRASRSGFGGRGGGRSLFSSRCGKPRQRLPTGRVVATVLRRDGSPAAGALVRIRGLYARADLRGEATLEHVAIGEHELGLRETGLVPTTCAVAVAAGRTTRVTLREAAGATVHVRVVDGEGEGLPYAILDLPPAPEWVDLHEGVQRLDPFTDVEGRRTLRRMPIQRRRLAATYGSRTGSVELDLRDGAAQTVTITIK
jgi:hypothetical protein